MWFAVKSYRDRDKQVRRTARQRPRSPIGSNYVFNTSILPAVPEVSGGNLVRLGKRRADGEEVEIIVATKVPGPKRHQASPGYLRSPHCTR